MDKKEPQIFKHAPGISPPLEETAPKAIDPSVPDTLTHFDGLGKIGEGNYALSISEQKDSKEYKLIPKTQEEKVNEGRESLWASLNIRPNRLYAASVMKVFWSYFGAIAAILAEFFVFQSIAENVLEIDENKSYFVALFAVVFTKFIQAAFLPKIKEWIKENNTRLHNWFKTLLFLFVILILVNAITVGLNNIFDIDRTAKLENILFLQEENPDSPELEQALADFQQNDNTLFSIVRLFAIAFLGFLAIPCASLLWALGDLYFEALKRKIEKIKLQKELSRIRSTFHYLIETHADLLSLQKEIICLFGHKTYYEKLMSEAVQKDVQTDIESK